MRIKLLLFCALLLVSISAFGNEKMDLAKEVMVLTKYDQTIERVKAHAERIQTEMRAELKLADGKNEKVTESLNELQASIFDEMEKQLVEILATVYTIEELKGMIEFWKSPIGRSVIEKQPLVLEKTMELSQKIMKLYIQEIRRLMDDS